jgi:hypothetical protein
VAQLVDQTRRLRCSGGLKKKTAIHSRKRVRRKSVLARKSALQVKGLSEAAGRARLPARRNDLYRNGRRLGRRGQSLRARTRPAPRGMRHRGRARRALDDDGVDRESPSILVLPAAPPLRAELPRASPPRAIRRGPLHGLRNGYARDDCRCDRRRTQAKSRLSPGGDARRRARSRAHRGLL